MKTDRKTDLSLLENAEDGTLNRMTECYAAASDKDKERIYRISEKMYKRKLNTYNRKNKGIVKGVERYNCPKWYKAVMTAAACLVLAGGIAGGGILLFNSSKNVVPQTENENTTNTDISQTTEVTTTAEETEPTQKFRELQLHEVQYADSEEEAEELVNQHMIECKFDERYGVDVEHYVEQLRNSDDLNTLENKSYIYHMMLNSIDYYSTVQGSGTSHGKKFEFKADLVNHKMYSKQIDESDYGTIFREEYFLDEFLYELSSNNSSGGVSSYKKKFLYNYYEDYGECYSEDNYRRVYLTYPESEYIDDSDYCSFGDRKYQFYALAESTLIYPDIYALDKLWDFDSWKINLIEEYNGRECALISGTHKDVMFKMYIDIQTGIMMYYFEDIPAFGGITMNIDKLEVDSPCEITLPDLDGCLYLKDVEGGDTIYATIPFNRLEYPVNENDQTYGSIADYEKLKSKIKSHESMNYENPQTIFEPGGIRNAYFPDLFKVIGDNGKEGYVLTQKCLHSAGLSTYINHPLAVTGYKLEPIEPDTPEFVLEVYESDGITQVDTYTLVCE